MNLPKVGSVWKWTNENYSIITDVPIEVTSVTDKGVIIVEITDTELLEEDGESAMRTYEKNGNDLDNMTEVHPFVTGIENGDPKIDDTWMFFRLEKFREQCEKQ